MLGKITNKTVFLAMITMILVTFSFSVPCIYADDQVVPKIKKSSSKKKKKKEATTEDILKAAGSDSVENVINKLGFDYVTATDGIAIKTPPGKPKKPYVGDFTANTIMASNGLIEVPTPTTTPRGKFQVGLQYVNRRINIGPQMTLDARMMFQTLTFGVMKNAEVGFGSSGYYKSSNNTTFLTGKFRLTNPERSKFQASIGVRTIDFGTSGVSNSTNYFGAFSFDVHGSNIYFQLINDGANSTSDMTIKGGVIIQMRELMPQPSALVLEALQDANNNFSKYNFGIRTAFAENALFDLTLMKDININELSPSVGLTLKF